MVTTRTAPRLGALPDGSAAGRGIQQKRPAVASPPEGLASQLLSEGLLDERQIVDQGVRIELLSGRNEVLCIAVSGEGARFLKRAKRPGLVPAIRREADILQLLASAADLPAGWIPAVAARGETWLELESLGTLVDLQKLARQETMDRALARRVGELLARVHEIVPKEPEKWPLATPPWAAMLAAPGFDDYKRWSPATEEAVRYVQSVPGLPESIRSETANPEPQAVVHGDFRWANLMVTPGDTAGRLAIVDWEFAGRGNPLLDIGMYLAHHVSAWLVSMPVFGGVSVRESASRALRPLDSEGQAAAAFWSGYRLHRRADAVVSAADAARATAIGLLQITLEHTQGMSSLSGAATLHLQVAQNMLERPDDAARQLLGLSEGHG